MNDGPNPDVKMPPATVEFSIQMFETKIDNCTELRHLAIIDGRVVGHVSLYFQPFNIGCIRELFVEESQRGKGIGRSLVQAACQTAKMRDCKVANLVVKRKNTSAFVLYYRMGFDVIGWFDDSEDIAMARKLIVRAEPYPSVDP